LEAEPQVLTGIKEKFLDTLRELDQEHIANTLSGETTGKQPMSDVNLTLLLTRAYMLRNFIDPSDDLLAELCANGTFRKSDWERIKSKKTCDEQVEEMLGIIERKSDCAFEKFKVALNSVGQSHVVYILTDGEEGEPPVCQEDIEALIRNRYDLISRMDPVGSGLLDFMVMNGSFSISDRQRAYASKNYPDINGAILDIIIRKPQSAFDKFFEALDSTCQKHVTSNYIRSNASQSVNVDVQLNANDDKAIDETGETTLSEYLN
jgi:Caspase recruitment domain